MKAAEDLEVIRRFILLEVHVVRGRYSEPRDSAFSALSSVFISSLKPRMACPIPFPIPDRRFAPKMRIKMKIMITSYCKTIGPINSSIPT